MMAFLASSFVLGAVEGFARGYWPEDIFEGRWVLWLFEEWWLYAGTRLLPASVIGLLLYRFLIPYVRTRWQFRASWWSQYLALLGCFLISTIPAIIWGYVYSLPFAFALSVGAAAAALHLEGRPTRAAV